MSKVRGHRRVDSKKNTGRHRAGAGDGKRGIVRKRMR